MVLLGQWFHSYQLLLKGQPLKRLSIYFGDGPCSRIPRSFRPGSSFGRATGAPVVLRAAPFCDLRIEARAEAWMVRCFSMRDGRWFVALIVSLAWAEQLPTTVFSPRDGIHATVNRIVPDSKGFVWFPGNEGLARFDGNAFRMFTSADG